MVDSQNDQSVKDHNSSDDTQKSVELNRNQHVATEKPVELISAAKLRPEAINQERQSPTTPKLHRRRSKTMLFWSIGLFFLTFASTTFVGSDLYKWVFISDPLVRAEILRKTGYWGLISNGFYYSVPVMSILLAHELGHYLQCLRYKVRATPPLFIPFPVFPLGTMGAVILQSPRIRHCKVLFDIAISGPLAGLMVVIPLMFYSLSYCKYEYVAPGTEVFGDPPIFRMVAEWIKGPLPATHGIKIDGIGLAVWVGLLVTGLNLVPIGQLDGGHILYALVRRKSHDIALFLMIFVGAYMLLTFNFQYVLMFGLMLSIGIYHPPTLNDQLPLGWFRTILGWGTLSFLLIGFTPMPIQKQGGPHFKEPKQEKILIQKSMDKVLITNQLINQSNTIG